MAYEKFIKKDGKLYGPYIYHSKRVDGKVVSEYHGQKKIDFSKYSKFFLITAGVLLLGIFVYLFASSQKNVTGNAVLDLNANYKPGQPLEGKIQMSLQAGELIPSSSKLVLENNGKISEFNLKDLVSDGTINGNFYVKGTTVSGSGEGYGIAGEKEVFPEVSFILSVLSSQQTAEEVNTSNMETDSITNPETNTTTDTTTTSTTTDTTTTSTTTSENSPTTTTTSENSPTTTTTTTTTTTDPSVTSEVVSGLLASVSNFFLGLTPTGHAVAEFESEVNGKVSSGKSFTYTLREGQKAEIKPRSVKTNSKQLDDGEITLTNNANELVVTTSYFEKETGFGNDYTGNEGKEIVLDISKLNLILTDGDLKVSIVSQGQKLLSLTTTIKAGGAVSIKETIVQKPTIQDNQSSIISEQPLLNGTLVLPVENVTLTESEKAILTKEFGNISVQVPEAKLKNGFIVIRYTYGNRWIENSYSSALSNQTLYSSMEADKIKWLKDIAKSFSPAVPELSIDWLEGNNSNLTN